MNLRFSTSHLQLSIVGVFASAATVSGEIIPEQIALCFLAGWTARITIWFYGHPKNEICQKTTFRL